MIGRPPSIPRSCSITAQTFSSYLKAISQHALLAAVFQFGCLTALIPEAHAQGGVPLWTNLMAGKGGSLAVDSSGNVFVAAGYDYVTVAYSSAGVPLWTNRCRWPGNSENVSTSLAVDTNGNVFVTGYTSPTNYSPADYMTVAYSAAGQTLWTNIYNGLANDDDKASSVAVDSTGSVFVTGYSYGLNLSGRDYATVAYSTAGVPLWTNRYNGPGNGDDVASAAAADTSGNAIITGTSVATNGYSDYATIKYSGAGVPLWTNLYNGPGNDDDEATALAVDSVGNIFVTGYSDLSFGGPREYATVGYSSLGLPLWTNCYLGPASSVDVPSGVAVDSNGNVFVTGASKSTNGYFEYATIKYSGIGMPLWTNRYHGSGNAGDSANAIAVDQDGNVFVTGSSSAGTPDYATIAYSSAGAPLWTNLYDGPGGDPAGSADIATAMAVDGSGNIFVTGYSYSPNGYYYPYATIKYSSSLRPLLSFQALNRQGILRWSNSAFTLQSAPSLTGTFTNIPGATSPYTNPVAGAQQYFRLVAP